MNPSPKSRMMAGAGPVELLLLLALLLAGARPLQAAGPVVISEFLASNVGGLMDEDGDSPDWIELFNDSANAVSLAGWHLTDDAADLTKWTFPATNIGAKSFLIVLASGKDRAVAGAPLHANFTLDANGEYLALVQPDGVTLASEFVPSFPPQRANNPYGLSQTVTTNALLSALAPARIFVPSNNTLGLAWVSNAFDDSGWLLGTNGVGYETSVPGFAVRNFKANVVVGGLANADAVINTPAQQTSVFATNAAVINFTDSQGDGHYTTGNFAFPGQTITQNADDFVLEMTTTITIPTAGAWTFGVNSDDGFRLVIGTNAPILFDAPRGPGDTLGTINFPAAGDYPLRLVYYERSGGAEVEFFAAPGSLATWNSTAFRLVGDVANGGLAVRSPPVSGGTGIGYRSMIRTDVASQMFSNQPTAYVRLPFSLTNAAALGSLYLQVKYDDGFAAYLNGTEIARRNTPAPLDWNSTAPTSHLASAYETINLSEQIGLLQEGDNLLAVQGLNDAADSVDFFILAELVELQVTPGTNSYFTTPTPGDYNRNPGFNGYVADTKFSHDHGFYATNFLLAITSATPGATIKYTLNGSAPSATNGFTYAGPIPITNTTTLRAVALLAGLAASDIDTMTYIFVNDVVLQRDEIAPGPGWPAQRKATGSGQVYDYGMDPDIVNNAIWGATIREDLKSLPSFSLVMDLRDLFDPTTGIYANPSGDEIAWERPGSVELIQPDGTKGFQINCGVRVRGGFSRSPDNPKHAFRFFFRQKYGANKLDYPLFGSDAAQSFDKVDLRTFQNYSWAFQNDPKMICLRDQFSRDAQLALNQPAEHGDFFHLYINGQYWGLYNTDERAEASYGESYFGGFQEDYDTVKVDPDLGYLIEPTDGNLDAWFRLWQVATNGFANDADYFRIQGLNLDGTPNPAYENLLDIDNLIDYMLVIVFGGNLDAPISNFLANDSPNNWFGMRHRGGLSGGFKFFAHDSEHTLRVDGGELTRDRTGLVNNQSGGAIDPDWTAGNPLTQINNSVYSPADAFSKSSPQYLWFRLAANPEFRLRVADHVQKSFFDGGVFTTEGGRAMFLARSNQIYRAIVCESARWGDAKTTTPYNRNTWITEMNNIGGQYFSQRPAIVLGQLRARGLFPNVLAPRFSQNGGFITFGSSLFLTNLNANSTLYYTLDGQDPRARGGNPAATAQSYTAGTPIPILFQTTVRARVRSNTVWSAITEATFYPIQDLARLLVSEVMYNPPPFAGSPGDDFEFIELKNVGTNTLELGGFQFTDGITFTFTNGTRLAGGQFVVLVRNPAKFSAKYPGVAIHGTYTGRLDNGGEKLTLTHPLGGVVFSFDYKDSGRWPITPDGYGFSLVPRHPNANPDPDGPSNWRASAMSGGSPGLDDPEPAVARIVINEALTHSVSPDVDRIELFNPTDAPVDLGGWFLTDDAARPMKFRIPDGTMILARSYRLFTESDFNPVPATTNNFALSGEGDELYLLSGDASTNLTGYSHGFSFGAAATNVSFGLLVTSDGVEHFPAQLANTLGATNAGPLVGPLVIAQIMYHPPDLPGGLDDSTNEFVEIRNISGADVALFDPDRPMNTWHVRGGINFDFPTNIVLPSGQSLVVVTFNSADATLLAKFRARYNSFAGVPAFGPAAGKLSNDRDSIELNRPGVPTTNGVPRIVVDEVSYRDFSPWPAAADGTGAALQRLHLAEYGNEPTNWAGQIPLSLFTQPLSQTTRATSNVVFSVGAIGTGPLTYQWRLNGTNLANGGGFSGVATSALVITNAFAQHRGVYTVVVTDSRDSAISVPATLEVQIAPIIIAQPQSLTAPAGSTVSFTIVLSNATSLPVGYRWRSNFTTRPFITLNDASSTFTITNVTLGANFSVILTNVANAIGLLSATAVLTVPLDFDNDQLPDLWELQYGFSPTNSADATNDFDGDGMSNLQEYLAGTNPTNALSYLRINTAGALAGGGTTLTFSAVSNKTYTIQYRDEAGSGAWLRLADFTAATTNRVVAYTNAVPGSFRRFYRLTTPKLP